MKCGKRLEDAVKRVQGVRSAALEIKTGKLSIVHASSVTEDALKAAIASSPFKLVALHPPSTPSAP